MTDLQTLIARHVTPKQPEPTPDMVDCTDRPDIIHACERNEINDPIGGWYEGRFYVYRHSLRQFRGQPVECMV